MRKRIKNEETESHIDCKNFSDFQKILKLGQKPDRIWRLLQQELELKQAECEHFFTKIKNFDAQTLLSFLQQITSSQFTFNSSELHISTQNQVAISISVQGNDCVMIKCSELVVKIVEQQIIVYQTSDNKLIQKLQLKNEGFFQFQWQSNKIKIQNHEFNISKPTSLIIGDLNNKNLIISSLQIVSQGQKYYIHPHHCSIDGISTQFHGNVQNSITVQDILTEAQQLINHACTHQQELAFEILVLLMKENCKISNVNLSFVEGYIKLNNKIIDTEILRHYENVYFQILFATNQKVELPDLGESIESRIIQKELQYSKESQTIILRQDGEANKQSIQYIQRLVKNGNVFQEPYNVNQFVFVFCNDPKALQHWAIVNFVIHHLGDNELQFDLAILRQNSSHPDLQQVGIFYDNSGTASLNLLLTKHIEQWKSKGFLLPFILSALTSIINVSLFYDRNVIIQLYFDLLFDVLMTVDNYVFGHYLLVSQICCIKDLPLKQLINSIKVTKPMHAYAVLCLLQNCNDDDIMSAGLKSISQINILEVPFAIKLFCKMSIQNLNSENQQIIINHMSEFAEKNQAGDQTQSKAFTKAVLSLFGIEKTDEIQKKTEPKYSFNGSYANSIMEFVFCGDSGRVCVRTNVFQLYVARERMQAITHLGIQKAEGFLDHCEALSDVYLFANREVLSQVARSFITKEVRRVLQIRDEIHYTESALRLLLFTEQAHGAQLQLESPAPELYTKVFDELFKGFSQNATQLSDKFAKLLPFSFKKQDHTNPYYQLFFEADNLFEGFKKRLLLHFGSSLKGEQLTLFAQDQLSKIRLGRSELKSITPETMLSSLVLKQQKADDAVQVQFVSLIVAIIFQTDEQSKNFLAAYAYRAVCAYSDTLPLIPKEFIAGLKQQTTISQFIKYVTNSEYVKDYLLNVVKQAFELGCSWDFHGEIDQRGFGLNEKVERNIQISTDTIEDTRRYQSMQDERELVRSLLKIEQSELVLKSAYKGQIVKDNITSSIQLVVGRRIFIMQDNSTKFVCPDDIKSYKIESNNITIHTKNEIIQLEMDSRPFLLLEWLAKISYVDRKNIDYNVSNLELFRQFEPLSEFLTIPTQQVSDIELLKQKGLCIDEQILTTKLIINRESQCLLDLYNFENQLGKKIHLWMECKMKVQCKERSKKKIQTQLNSIYASYCFIGNYLIGFSKMKADVYDLINQKFVFSTIRPNCSNFFIVEDEICYLILTQDKINAISLKSHQLIYSFSCLTSSDAKLFCGSRYLILYSYGAAQIIDKYYLKSAVVEHQIKIQTLISAVDYWLLNDYIFMTDGLTTYIYNGNTLVAEVHSPFSPNQRDQKYAQKELTGYLLFDYREQVILQGLEEGEVSCVNGAFVNGIMAYTVINE